MASQYKDILDGFTWSFSRCMSFVQCPYKMYLTYIEKADKDSGFYAEYGKFIHEVLEKYFKREINEEEALEMYVENFDYEVTARVKETTREKLFMAGVDYFTNLEWELDDYEILGIEKEIRFKVGKHKFVGYIDLLLRHKETGDLIVVDNKSGEFPLGKKGQVLKAHQESYENYKKQLYLYSIAIHDEYGVYPKTIKWNYTRDAKWLELPFIEKELEETKTFILDILKRIYKEKEFNPNQSYTNCVLLCDVWKNCAYNGKEQE